jgi:peptide deformylase
MSIRPLCVLPQQVLRTPARPVEEFTNGLRELVRDLIDTMYAHDGVGLAAPQIGEAVQVFVANPSRQRGRELVVVNPQPIVGEGRAAVTEGCLSIPKVWQRIERLAHIQLAGQDASGSPLRLEADGLLAVVLQHECDHLQGRLFIDRLSWVHRQWLRARLAMRSCG